MELNMQVSDHNHHDRDDINHNREGHVPSSHVLLHEGKPINESL